MFNLDQAIAQWRQQMASDGIKTPALLDELQNHLCEDVERQLQSGADARQAFESAVQRLGQASVLKAEFAKCGGPKEARSGKVIGIACCAFAGLFSLLVLPRLLTIHELGMPERIWGLAAVAVTMLSIASFRFSYRCLPVIREQRVRMAVGVGCGLMGAVWLLVFGNLLADVIVPHIFGGANGAGAANSVRGAVIIGLKVIPPTGHEPVFLIGISILWAMALTAALGGIAYGIEEAARRRATTADS
jgi:hypothetical protein